MKMVDEGALYFNKLEESYILPTEVVASFTIVRFAPSKHDWIGLFDVSDIKNVNPIVQRWFPVESFSEDDISLPWTSSVSFNLDSEFVKDSQPRICEARYVNISNEVVAKSQVFHVITSDFDHEINDTRNELDEKKFSLVDIDGWTGVSQRLPSKCSSDGSISTSSSSHGETSSLVMVDRESRISVETKMEDMRRTVALQMKLMDRNQEELNKLKIGYEREKTINEALKEEMYVDSTTRDNEIEDLRSVALSYKKECQRVQALQESNDDLIDSLKCKIMEDKELHLVEMEKMRADYQKALADYEKGMGEMESEVLGKETKVNELEETMAELSLKVKCTEAMKSQLECLREKVVELENCIEEEKCNHKDVTDEYDRTTQVSNLLNSK